MGLTTFLQQYLVSIFLGGAHALIATGYTLVYSTLRLINFAHGDIFVVVGYSVILVMVSLSWFITIPVTLLVTVVLGVSIKHVAYRPLRSAPRMSATISAIGASYLLQNFVIYLFTILPKGYPEIPFLKRIYRIGGLSALFVTFLTPVPTLILVYLLIALINHTKIGMAVRAISRDYETASLMGIKINKAISPTFAVGSLLTGISSTPYFMDRIIVFPFSGALPGLKCFMAAVFGGIGNIPDTVVGDFILGLGKTALVAMGQSTFSDASTFILLIVTLLIRPIGLFGEKTTDRV